LLVVFFTHSWSKNKLKFGIRGLSQTYSRCLIAFKIKSCIKKPFFRGRTVLPRYLLCFAWSDNEDHLQWSQVTRQEFNLTIQNDPWLHYFLAVLSSEQTVKTCNHGQMQTELFFISIRLSDIISNLSKNILPHTCTRVKVVRF
jgi:hypothetical protein